MRDHALRVSDIRKMTEANDDLLFRQSSLRWQNDRSEETENDFIFAVV